MLLSFYLVLKAWLQDLRDVGYDVEDLTEVREADIPKQSQQQASSRPSLAVKGQSWDGRVRVLLVIAVISARRDRRDAIRRSWLTWGDERVEIRFFTEAPESGSADEAALGEESAAHGDLVFMNIDPGMNFALKLVWAMRWMFDRFTFEFFLRLDDDYFLCLKRLLDELDKTEAKEEHPLTIYAGHLYCNNGRRSTRIDEAYLLLSAELVRRVLEAPHLKCGGHAGVTAGWWFTKGNPLNQLGDVQWIHDPRLDHEGTWLSGPPEMFVDTCASHMGVHHAYPDIMLGVWEAAKDSPGPRPGGIGNSSLVFAYVDDGACNVEGARVSDDAFGHDNAQLCDTFTSENTRIHCGQEGC